MRFIKIHGPMWIVCILVFLISAVLLVGVQVALAGDDSPANKGQAPCPVSTLRSGCYDCHVKGKAWPAVMETNPDEVYDYPNRNIKILASVDGEKYGYYQLGNIEADGVQEFFRYMKRHKIKKTVIEIFSPGGSMMQVLKIVELMIDFQREGGIVETRCYGYALSAGFLTFAAGTPGHRFAAPHALLMWHEVQTFKQWDLSNPSAKEDEARLLRFFQDNGHNFLAKRCKMTKQELDEAVHKKEFWMTGQEAVGYGFADGLLGE